MSKSKKLFTLFAAGAAMLLSSCGGNIVESYHGQQSPTADLNVVVLEFGSNKPIEGAKVTLLNSQNQRPQSGVRSAISTVTFRSVHVGTQKVLVEYEGTTAEYASMIVTTTIERDASESEDVYIANQNTVIAHLFPLTSTLQGFLYYEDKDGKDQPANGATVRLELRHPDPNAEFVNRIISQPVAAGSFSFSKLPAIGTNYELTALERAWGGITFREMDIPNAAPLTLGTTAYLKDKNVYRETTSKLIYLGANALTIGAKDTLKLEFNEDIADSENFPRLYVDPAHAITVFPTQAVKISYTGKTVTIVPLDEWNPGSFEVTINDKLASVKGNNVESYVFITVNVLAEDLSAKFVTGLYRDSTSREAAAFVTRNSDSTALLRWSPVAGADSYDIFVRFDGTNNFVKVEDNLITPGNNNTSAIVKINDGFEIDDKINTFVVQAVNSRSKSTLVGAAQLDVFSRPTLDYLIMGDLRSHADSMVNVPVGNPTGGGISETNFNDWLRAAVMQSADVSFSFRVTFTEEMKAATGVITSNEQVRISGLPAALESRVSVQYIWGANASNYSEEYLTVTVRVASTTEPTTTLPASPLSIVINGLKNKNDKDFFVQYDTAYPEHRSRGIHKIIRNQLNFRANIAAI